MSWLPPETSQPPAAPTNDTSPPAPTNFMSLIPIPPSVLPTPASESNGMFSAKVIGPVSGTVFLLFVAVICVRFYKWRKGRRVRNHGLDDYSAAPPSQPNADQLGGPSQQLQHNVPPPTGVLLNQHALSHNVASPPTHPACASSPAFALRQSQSSFRYEDLEFATNGFSDSNLLGQGGFGYVHKGVLLDGKTVAIKRLKSGSTQGEREFQAEVEVISRIHHRHLVSLVGYCSAGDQRMLVYEFVPNNTLEFHLHGKDRTMVWATRKKIAIGSAKGLAYLHEGCHPRIIHRDIKASNILLDDNFEAKVADFGLAKFFPDVDTHISTQVKGTIGYLDPEYAGSGKLTEKSDVFSYGVVLLELITGLKPVDKTKSSQDGSMVEWARPLLSQAMENGNFDALADSRLQKSYNPDEMLRMIACAANCVRHSARQRPRMSQVVQALDGNISLDDLNKGSIPEQDNVDLKKYWKLALEQETIKYSGPSSDCCQYQSAFSCSDLQNAQGK